MKLLRIAAVAALTAFGSITGGARVVHATTATGVLLGAPAVKTLQTPTRGLPPRKGLLLLQASLLASLLSPALLASAVLVKSNLHKSIRMRRYRGLFRLSGAFSTVPEDILEHYSRLPKPHI